MDFGIQKGFSFTPKKLKSKPMLKKKSLWKIFGPEGTGSSWRGFPKK